MTVIHVLPKRFEDFLRHLDCNSPRAHSENPGNRWQPSAVGDCAHAILRDYRVEAKGLEPIVRDALEMYALAYTEADDISRGTLERRAKFANRWMALHGFGMVDTHMDGCGEC